MEAKPLHYSTLRYITLRYTIRLHYTHYIQYISLYYIHTDRHRYNSSVDAAEIELMNYPSVPIKSPIDPFKVPINHVKSHEIPI